MILLVDFSQVVIANIMANFYKTPEKINDEDTGLPITRHLVFDQLRRLKMMHSQEDLRVVICCDGGYSWRREFFPPYKARRRKNKTDDRFNWAKIHEYMTTVKQDIIDHFPYTVIENSKAEADDIIGTLAKHFYEEGVVIVSRDNDFKQLQRYPNVRQYNMIDDKWVVCEDPKMELKNKVLSGDSGDDVPNVLSDDDTFINDGKRQRPLGAKKLAEWEGKNLLDIIRLIREDPKYKDVTIQDNVIRNNHLINLQCTPAEIQADIIEQFNAVKEVDRTKIYNFLYEANLIQLMHSVQQF
jgi:5'-3' exonuclease